MNNVFFKGLLAAIIGCIASLMSVKDAGISYWAITILGVILTYFGQHAIIKSVSVFGTVDLMDILKGILIAVGTAISSYIASLANATAVDWHNVLTAALAAAIAYLAKNLFSNSQGVLGTEPKQAASGIQSPA